MRRLAVPAGLVVVLVAVGLTFLSGAGPLASEGARAPSASPTPPSGPLRAEGAPTAEDTPSAWAASQATRVDAHAEACGQQTVLHCVGERCALAVDLAPWAAPLAYARRPSRLVAYLLGGEDPCMTSDEDLELIGIERSGDRHCLVLAPGPRTPGGRVGLTGHPLCAVAFAEWDARHGW